MTSPSLPGLLRRLLLAVLLCVVPAATATAHIEKGPMPDAIAEIEYAILLEFEPGNLEVRNRLGMVLFRRGKLDEAADQFREILRQDPANFHAMDGLGVVTLNTAQPENAAALFRQAIGLNRDDTMVHYHLGQALEQYGDIAAAIDAYNTALENARKNGSAETPETRQIIEAVSRLKPETDPNKETLRR